MTLLAFQTAIHLLEIEARDTHVFSGRSGIDRIIVGIYDQIAILVIVDKLDDRRRQAVLSASDNHTISIKGEGTRIEGVGKLEVRNISLIVKFSIGTFRSPNFDCRGICAFGQGEIGRNLVLDNRSSRHLKRLGTALAGKIGEDGIQVIRIAGSEILR